MPCRHIESRAAYRTSVENSIYVDRQYHGHGIGRLLLSELVSLARHSGFHTVFARINSASEASIGLHSALGYTVVGVEREVGRKFNRWQDVTLMQLLIP